VNDETLMDIALASEALTSEAPDGSMGSTKKCPSWQSAAGAKSRENGYPFERVFTRRFP